MTASRQLVRNSLLALAPAELTDRLLADYDELVDRFMAGDLRPAQLSGGRLAESALRICEHVVLGQYTPIGKSLPRTDDLLRKLEQSPAASANEAFRLHIPRAVRTIYDLRNKRDVAHLGAEVSPNLADSSLVVAVAAWVLAELVRLGHTCTADEAQHIVDALVQRRVPLVWEEGDLLRVLEPSLTASERTLLLLHHRDPEWVPDSELCRWVEYSSVSKYRSNVLAALHEKALIHFVGGKARILPPGIKAAESLLARLRRDT